MSIGTPTSIGTNSLLTGAVNPTVTTSANIVAGNLLVLVISQNYGGGQTPVSCTACSDGTNSYTRAVSALNTSGSTALDIWYFANAQAVGSGATITITLGTNTNVTGIEIAAYQITGIVTSSPLDKTNSQVNSSTPSVATGTLTQAVEIIFGGCGLGGTSPSGLNESANFTQLYNHRTSSNTIWLDVGYDIVASTASVAYAPGPVGTGNQDTSVAVATFEGAASTGFIFNLANPLR